MLNKYWGPGELRMTVMEDTDGEVCVMDWDFPTTLSHLSNLHEQQVSYLEAQNRGLPAEIADLLSLWTS